MSVENAKTYLLAARAHAPGNEPNFTVSVGEIESAVSELEAAQQQEESNDVAEALLILEWILGRISELLATLQEVLDKIDEAMRKLDPLYDPPQ